MIIVMGPESSEQQLNDVINRIEELGYKSHTIRGVERTVVGAVGHEDKTPLQEIETMPGVESVIPILKPYKLVSTEFKKERTTIKISDNIEIGGNQIVVMAGPCSVESEEQIIESAIAAKEAGAHLLRGGAFKPRTSPYAFQGLEEEGLKILAKAREITGLKIVTEVVNVNDMPLLDEYADVIQIGARNCQNFALLKAAGQTRKPVLFKRGMMTTVKEYLMAAEYLLSQGNYNVILCERGIRTFEDATRFTLDLNAVPLIKGLTHLPIVVDPSHGTGHRNLVIPMSKAAIACGADGLIIEIHPHPEKAFSDGSQSLRPEMFKQLMEEILPIVKAVGKTL